MRLTHLKLAGFKSFVDPTTIHLHGQRVGVVGPNGCGKSNVMESVRWVLGESSAKEMRADAMDAVIFNGSANRKAISRASVELVFDNSLGGASGEWNQYAEISVKRVIEREKGSSYFINNTAVRRRDVADLFLGTGLGGRAYAIIGQNTISRIVEAKPEELRIFLEEAAGISKYKERRRETELRLRDTRENLTRVEDVCRELGKQIVKLEAQAVVTEQYHQLKNDLGLAEAQLWFLKKRDALKLWEKAKQSLEQSIIKLESQMADLRASESQLETCRQNHYAASEKIHEVQAQYYVCNANVSNLELQVKQSEEARLRLTQQEEWLQVQFDKNVQQQALLEQQLAHQQLELGTVEQQVAQSAQELTALNAGMPEKSQALKDLNALAQAAQERVQQQRQSLQIDQNNVQYRQKHLQELQQRLNTLKQELDSWVMPNQDELNVMNASVTTHQSKLAEYEQALQASRTKESELLLSVQEGRQQQQQAQRALSQAEAEIQSLTKLQQSMQQTGDLGAWVQQHGLQSASRLWEHLQVPADWQHAFEALLGFKLNAFVSDKAGKAQKRPQQALALVSQGSVTKTSLSSEWNGLPSLLSLIQIKSGNIDGVLNEWLHGVYVLSDDAEIEQYRAQLPLGCVLLTQDGDVFGPHSIVYHGQASAINGVLDRQQQLEKLKDSLPNLQQQEQHLTLSLKLQEQQLQDTRALQQQTHQAIKQETDTLHQANMQLSRLKQQQENALKRQQSLQQEMAEHETKIASLNDELAKLQSNISTIEAGFAQVEKEARKQQQAKQQAEQHYFALRDALQQAEKAHQSLVFKQTLAKNTLADVTQKLDANTQEQQSLEHRLQETRLALSVSNMETLKQHLSDALTQQHEAEQALAQARNHLTEQEQALQAQERLRMQQEQQLHPLRDDVEQGRLKEQESRIAVEQCDEGLKQTGFTQEQVSEGLPEEASVQAFLQKTQQIQQKIERLGPVNMAAIEELNTEKERKVYLDSQMQDLLTASATLEDAIQKIDRETRGKLKATYDEANRNFGELFVTLFNGGQAKLELLGDEILDTGVQVFAQPPGKKNTTIQLLSGGEKALTAIALVFALFKLNPSPFCLMDEVDAPLDDSNTERFCKLVQTMSEKTQFLFVSHNKITMEMSQQLIGVTMQESGVSRIVDVDVAEAIRMHAA